MALAADLKNSPGAIYPGQPKKQRAGCTITLTDEDYVALANGDLNPQQVREENSEILRQTCGIKRLRQMLNFWLQENGNFLKQNCLLYLVCVDF